MIKTALSVVSSAAMLTGCAAQTMAPPQVAVATLNPASGSNTQGTVTFTLAGNKVAVIANVKGLTPGPHGFHIHENGDCSGTDAAGAGDHFNPDNRPHGPSYREGGHMGDLGNLIADGYGNAQVRMQLDGGVLEDKKTNKNGFLGRSVVVHNNIDDLVSQPSGNSGARIACGIIKPQ